MMVPLSVLLVCLGILGIAFGLWLFSRGLDALTNSKPRNQSARVSPKDPEVQLRQSRTILLFAGIVFGMGIVLILQQLAP